MSTDFLQDFQAARKRSVPLLAIETSDPNSSMRLVAELVKEEAVIMSWDIAAGLKARNETAAGIMPDVCQEPAMLNNPVEFLLTMEKLPKNAIIFMLNGHRFIGSENTNEAAVGQAIWNLRDKFKKDGRMLVILCPSATLPEELKNDVMVLEDPLPNTEELQKIITKLFDSSKLKLPTAEVLDKATETIRGLSAFAAEQSVAMSLTKAGLNLEKLWDRKRKAVEQTQGLSVYKGKETYKDITGVPVIKDFLSKLFKGNRPPTVLVFLDEIEKMFGGIAGDLSGTSQEQLGEFLRWMQDMEVLGMLLAGHPGCSKSLTCKCTAGEFEVPMAELNVTALKGSLVGQTGQLTRAALKQVSAMGRPLIIATANSLAILPPELKRRFMFGTWFFDLPNEIERKSVLDLYVKKYELKNIGEFKSDGWTPAEIRTACDIAWRLNCSIEDAAKFVVPIFKSDPERIEKLRRDAHNRFNDASKGGAYVHSKMKEIVAAETAIRAIDLSGPDIVGRA